MTWMAEVAMSVLLSAAPGSGGWQKLDTEPYDRKQDDVFFIDPKRGWYGNGEGKLYQTKDGGVSWERIWKRKGTFIRALGFVDERRGFMGNVGTDYYPGVTDDVPLYRTDDGGKTWKPVKELEGSGFKGVCSIDIDRIRTARAGAKRERVMIHVGGRVGGPAYVARSLDGGDTWMVLDLSQRAGMVLDVDFFDERTGLVFASSVPKKGSVEALILRTDDGGQTWRAVYRSGRPTENVWKSSFPNRKVGYATVQTYDSKRAQQVVVKTEDGGRSWQELPLVKDNAAREYGIGFIDADFGWVGTTNHGFETRDGGRTWRPVDLGKAVNRIRIVRGEGGPLAYAIGTELAKWMPPPSRRGP